MEQLKKKAKELSKEFIENEKEYMLGFVEAEKANTITRHLSDAYCDDTLKGINVLVAADKAVVEPLEAVIMSDVFDAFADRVYSAIKSGGRVVVSGCGSTGRLAMRIEASWRQAMRGTEYEDAVISLMTGGDYALIRAVESFEDYIQLGQMQAWELGLGEKDLLIGVTATGETTSILGTAQQALNDGASVYMVVCTRPETLLNKLKRADDVYTHKNCSTVYIACGGMAVTGSTRMQSTTLEQTVIASALELAIARIEDRTIDKHTFVEGFISSISCVENAEDAIKAATEKETALYKNGGHVTYFADEFLLDVLADTTERGPTFAVPPFRPQCKKSDTLSWAFVKNPYCHTEDAWSRCFERAPRCIDKTAEEYLAIGVKESDVLRIPKINADALYQFEIGCEPDQEREAGESLSMWVGNSAPDEQYNSIASRYKESLTFIIPTENAVKTRMKIFEHIALKLAVNIMSTGTMAKMGRIYGNYMVCLNISNKKLVDRATRIISDLCGIDYETANYELFLTKLMLENDGIQQSPVKATIDRLGRKKLL